MTPPAQMRYQVYNYKGPTPDSWSALRTQSWARLLWSAGAGGTGLFNSYEAT
jgi:hypothetical protein